MEDDFDDQWYDDADGRDDIADDENDLDNGFSFLYLAEEATIAVWDAVEAEWNEVPQSYAHAGHTFMALRAVLFRIQDIARGHSGEVDLSQLPRHVTKWINGVLSHVHAKV